jgi:hypothetical protein
MFVLLPLLNRAVAAIEVSRRLLVIQRQWCGSRRILVRSRNVRQNCFESSGKRRELKPNYEVEYNWRVYRSGMAALVPCWLGWIMMLIRAAALRAAGFRPPAAHLARRYRSKRQMPTLYGGACGRMHPASDFSP